MTQRAPLTVAQREAIYRDKLTGQSLPELATEHDCSYSCARKWWRTGRDTGLAGLRSARQARSVPGVLSTFAVEVAARALFWKRQHPKRGPTRILQDLRQDAAVQGQRLPQRSALAAFFQQACPELLQHREPRPAPPPRAQQVHERWQMDAKEGVHLQDGSIATVLDVREPVACVFLGSRAHAVQTEQAWRKLTLREIQADVRLVFRVFGLPQSIQTDREQVYGQPASEAFPSLFTLWLVGLGVQHYFGRPHQPTDQPQVERGHRTLFDWMEQPEPPLSVPVLQADLDAALPLHNAVLPSEAGDCQGRPPLQVHPEVLQVTRPYQPSAELALFSLQRVDTFLALFCWRHKVSGKGQVSVQGHVYGLGSAHAGKIVEVRFDPQDRHLVFRDAQTGQELKRCPIQGLDVATITGLEVPPAGEKPVQLSFPW